MYQVVIVDDEPFVLEDLKKSKKPQDYQTPQKKKGKNKKKRKR